MEENIAMKTERDMAPADITQLRGGSAARRLTMHLLRLLFFFAGTVAGTLMVYSPLVVKHLDGGGFWAVSLLHALPSTMALVATQTGGVLADRHRDLVVFLAGGTSAMGAFLAVLSHCTSAAAYVLSVGLMAFFPAIIFCVSVAWVTLHHPGREGELSGMLWAFESAGFAFSSFLWGNVMLSLPLKARVGRVTDGLALAGFLLAFLILTCRNLLETSLPMRSPSEGAEEGRGEWAPGCGACAMDAVAVVDEAEELGMWARLAALWRNAPLRRVFMAVFIVCGSATFFYSMYQLYFCEYLGGSGSLMGTSLGVTCVLGAFAFPLMGRLCDRIGHMRMLELVMDVYCVVYLLILAASVWGGPLLVAIVYALPLYPAFKVAGNSAAAEYTSEADRAGGVGIVESAYSAAALVGPLLGGLVAGGLGLFWMPVFAFLIALCGRVLVSLRRERMLRRVFVGGEE